MSQEKLESTWEKCNTIKIQYKDGDVILLRQDKGREIVTMSKGKYTQKCMNVLNIN